MDPIDIWLRAWILALSTALFVVSALAYSRERDRRMLIAAGLFLVFLVKGVILMLGLFSWDAEELVTPPGSTTSSMWRCCSSLSSTSGIFPMAAGTARRIELAGRAGGSCTRYETGFV